MSLVNGASKMRGSAWVCNWLASCAEQVAYPSSPSGRTAHSSQAKVSVCLSRNNTAVYYASVCGWDFEQQMYKLPGAKQARGIRTHRALFHVTHGEEIWERVYSSCCIPNSHIRTRCSQITHTRQTARDSLLHFLWRVLLLLWEK